MALNFPDSPTLNQIYTDSTSGFSYQWNGTVWISYSPASSSQIQALDDFSGSFNGVTQSFPLTSNGNPIIPAGPQSLIINLNGVVQDSTDDYIISGTNIVFTVAPTSGLSFSGISLGPAIPLNVVSNGSVTPEKISIGGPSWNTNGDVNISGVVTATSVSSNGVNVTGVVTATSVIANGQELIRGIGVATEGGTVGTGATILDFRGTGISTVTVSSGIATVNLYIEPSGGSGDGSVFNTGITTSVYVSVDSGIGIGVTDSNNIFIAPGIGYSFPSTSGYKYVIESIHVSNIFSNELYLSARHDFNGGTNTPIAQRIIVPYQGATELLEEPMIANPSDILRFQALDGTTSSSAGVDGGLDAFITISAKQDTNYVGVGTTVTSTGGTDQTIFTSTTNPSVLQSIRLINHSLNIDVDARVSIYRSEIRLGYLVYDLTIPKNSTVEILEKPKYLLASDSIRASSSNPDALSICISGKYIV